MRQGEGRPATLLFTAFFLLIAFQYAAKSVRQSTFIDSIGAPRLPYVYLAVALASYPILRIYSRLADRVARHHLITATCAAIAAGMVAFWWLLDFGWRWVAVLFYVWLSIVVVLTVSQLWSFAAHLFDARQARRLFGLIGAGGLLGSIAGGQAASVTTALVGTRYALLVAAGFLLGATSTILLAQRGGPPSDEGRERDSREANRLERARGGFALLLVSDHLRWIALLMTLTIVAAQVVDLQFNWAIERTTTTLDQRTGFFGNFYSVMGLAAFAFQILFTTRIHRRLGVGFAMRVLPVSLGLGSVALLASGALFPAALLPAALALKVGEGGLRYSLDQATRELLFLPLPAAFRIKSKAFVDVFVQRGAKGISALLLLPVALGLATPLHASWLALITVVGWLWLTVRLRHAYVAAFGRRLGRLGRAAPPPIDLGDGATLELLVRSLASVEARQVLHGLDLLAFHGRGRLVPPLLLYHDSPAVRRRTLEVLAAAERRDAAGLIARRLGDDDPEVRAQAARSLAGLEGKGVMELMRARAGDADPRVRAAAIACFTLHGDAADSKHGLEMLEGLLMDADPAARREAARALGTLPEPWFHQQLVALLYDGDPTVVAAAIAAVRNRAGREGSRLLYVPSLVSLLGRRALKHQAREALVAYGPAVVPPLVHFMHEPDEPLWVRRAIPKTLARIQAPTAIAALADGLRNDDDLILRRKQVEALVSLPACRYPELDPAALTEAVRTDVYGWFETALLLRAVGSQENGTLLGCTVAWQEESVPTLLQRLLSERLEVRLANLLDLLALLHPSAALHTAAADLTSSSAEVRSLAIEYLHNVLQGPSRRFALLVIGDEPLEERLQRARQVFVLPTLDRTMALRLLIDSATHGAAREEPWLAVAAAYESRLGKDARLRPFLFDLLGPETDPFVRQTAAWVLTRDQHTPQRPEVIA